MDWVLWTPMISRHHEWLIGIYPGDIVQYTNTWHYIYIYVIYICYICIWLNMSNYINSIHVNSDVCMDHLMCWHSWWMDVDGGLHGDWLFDSRLVFHDWIQTSIWNWLVVLTIWKNISQWERLSHILWKINNVWTHQPGNFNIFSPNERPGA